MNTITLHTNTYDIKAIKELLGSKNISYETGERITYVNRINERMLTRKEATELHAELAEKFSCGGQCERINIAYEFDTTERTLLVTRHAATKEFILEKCYEEVEHIQHLNIADVLCNDIVVGTLPINVVAKLYERGASYVHLSLDVPFEARGKELTIDDMHKYGATLQRYVVRAA